MANFNMNPYAGSVATPAVLPGADKGYGGRIIGLTATLTYAAQASGSTLTCFKANQGWTFLGGYFLTNTTTGSATLALGGTNGGVSTTLITNLYSAAAAYTTIDKPQWFMNNIAASTPYLTDPIPFYTGPETFIITTAAASLPASGILLVTGLFMIS